MELAKAIKLTYDLGFADSIKQVVIITRLSILNVFENSEKYSWPPGAEYLHSLNNVVPEILNRFLTIVTIQLIIYELIGCSCSLARMFVG